MDLSQVLEEIRYSCTSLTVAKGRRIPFRLKALEFAFLIILALEIPRVFDLIVITLQREFEGQNACCRSPAFRLLIEELAYWLG